MTDISTCFGNQTITTGAAAPKKPPAIYMGLLATIAFASPTTAMARAQIPEAVIAPCWTSTGPVPERPASHSGAVRRLKDRCGLSWQQLADAFGVSRRSLHFWVNGGNLAPANVQRLEDLSGQLASLGGLPPAAIRAELLRPNAIGLSKFDSWISQVRPARIAPPNIVAEQFALLHDTIQHRRAVIAADGAPLTLKDF